MPYYPGEAEAELNRCHRCSDGPVHPARATGIRSERVANGGATGSSGDGDGPEFVAKDVRAWIEAVGAKTAFIEPGSPWENGYVESFNARMRAELLNRIRPLS